MRWLRVTVTLLKAFLLTIAIILFIMAYISALTVTTCVINSVENWLITTALIVLVIMFIQEVLEYVVAKTCCVDYRRREAKSSCLLPCRVYILVRRYLNFTECFWRLKYRTRDIIKFLISFLVYLFIISINILLIYISYSKCVSRLSPVAIVSLVLTVTRLLVVTVEFVYYDLYLPDGVNRKELSRQHGRFMRESELGSSVCLAGEDCLSIDIAHILKCHEKLRIPTKENNIWYCCTCRSDYLIGFHQTSPEAALEISKSEMRAGESGLFGGGIYFARCIHHTEGKAHQKGALVCALVHVGVIKMVHAPDSKLNSRQLQSEGFDSVYAEARAGFLSRDEFVVYSPDRVKQWIIVI